MKKEQLYEVLGDINENYINDAHLTTKKKSRPAWIKWGAMAACFCLMLVGGILFNSLRPTDFHSMVTGGSVNNPLTITTLNIDGRLACYAQLNIDSSKLEHYVGEQYLAEDIRTWYYPTESGNLKYLIQKDNSGTLTLWAFDSFCMEEGETHTYGDILSIIYGVDSPEAIVSITTSPSKANNTDAGIAIQKKVGTQTYTSREDIEAFFSVVWDVVCYGADSESKADNNRFAYSFSTDSSDKLTSGESTYGTRCIKIEFADGSILDSWQYSALSGSFCEYGGIFTEPLSDEDVFVLNDIFGIK